jgi:carotenoid cleavage dioxygenase-like enzyme
MSWEHDMHGATYVRYVIDPDQQRMMQPPQTIVQNRNTEFPIIPTVLSTKEFRYSYTVGSHEAIIPSAINGTGAGPGGSILKIDTQQPDLTEIYTFLPYEFVGEPTFVPKVGADITKTEQEDYGYIVTYVFNGKAMTTDLVIFNVQGQGTLRSGPIARLQLPTFIPHGLHGIFVEGLTFDIEKSPK